METHQLSLRDLAVVREVARARSVREASRRLGMAPGAVSRIARTAEQRTGLVLFERSASGMVLTSAGQNLLKVVEQFLDNYDQLLQGEEERSHPWLTVASYSFLSNCLLSRVIGEPWLAKSRVSLRVLDVAPEQLVVVGLRGLFQIAVHIGKREWPSTWNSEKVGEVSWQLCVRRDHPLPARARERDLAQYGFVSPIGWDLNGIYDGDDYCPMKRAQRRIVHQVGTAELALHAVRYSDYLGYLPDLVCREWLARRALRAVSVRDWAPVVRPVFVSAKAELVPARVYSQLATTMGRLLAERG